MKRKVRAPKAVKRLREHLEMSAMDFGKALEVSHSAVLGWEHGSGISPWFRIVLLNIARDHNAPREVVEELERVQPEAVTL